MPAREVESGIYSVGAIDWDREFFDELIPLPDGTTYNAYVIRGTEKTALIDTVDPTKGDELIENLKSIGIERLDYIISNHAEQDHSGMIPKLLELYPEARVITNERCEGFLKNLLLIPDERFTSIDDGSTLSLGDKTLKFTFTPWVHWPETMVTYLVEDKILFSCDFFGSHLATSSLFAEEGEKLLESAKRYYAEIMMPFRTAIEKNIEKISELEIAMIAPSHGPIYKDPTFIIDAYKEWISDEVKNEEEMDHAMKFYRYLVERGGKVRLYEIKEPPHEWNSPLHAFEETLKHEKHITECINNLVELAEKEKDRATFNLLQWYVDEQVEEEANDEEIINYLKLIAESGNGLLMLDRELAKRTYVPLVNEEK